MPPEPDTRPGFPSASAPPVAHIFPLLDPSLFPFEPDTSKPMTAKGIRVSTGSLTRDRKGGWTQAALQGGPRVGAQPRVCVWRPLEHVLHGAGSARLFASVSAAPRQWPAHSRRSTKVCDDPGPPQRGKVALVRWCLGEATAVGWGGCEAGRAWWGLGGPGGHGSGTEGLAAWRAWWREQGWGAGGVGRAQWGRGVQGREGVAAGGGWQRGGGLGGRPAGRAAHLEQQLVLGDSLHRLEQVGVQAQLVVQLSLALLQGQNAH